MKIDEAASYVFGFEVGGKLAQELAIEIVCAIYCGTLEHMDECVSDTGSCKEVPDYVTGPEYRRGFADGLRAECWAIIDRLNRDRKLRVGE